MVCQLHEYDREMAHMQCVLALHSMVSNLDAGKVTSYVAKATQNLTAVHLLEHTCST